MTNVTSMSLDARWPMCAAELGDMYMYIYETHEAAKRTTSFARTWVPSLDLVWGDPCHCGGCVQHPLVLVYVARWGSEDSFAGGGGGGGLRPN